MQPIELGELPITTKDPMIQIFPTEKAPLPEGTHVFELVVEDDRGRKSPPDYVKVTVQKTAPEAALKGPKEPVELGAPFELSADGSSAVEGELTFYHWRLVPSDEADKI